MFYNPRNKHGNGSSTVSDKQASQSYDLNYFVLPLLLGDEKNACFDRLRCHDFGLLSQFAATAEASETGRLFMTGARTYERMPDFKRHIDANFSSNPYVAQMHGIHYQSRWTENIMTTALDGVRLRRPLLEKFKFVNQPSWLAGIAGGIVNWMIFILPIINLLVCSFFGANDSFITTILAVYSIFGLFFALGSMMYGYYPTTNHFHDYSVTFKKNTPVLLLTMVVCSYLMLIFIGSLKYYI